MSGLACQNIFFTTGRGGGECVDGEASCQRPESQQVLCVCQGVAVPLLILAWRLTLTSPNTTRVNQLEVM